MFKRTSSGMFDTKVTYKATINHKTCYTCEAKRFQIVDHLKAKKLDSGWLPSELAFEWLEENEYEVW